MPFSKMRESASVVDTKNRSLFTFFKLHRTQQRYKHALLFVLSVSWLGLSAKPAKAGPLDCVQAFVLTLFQTAEQQAALTSFFSVLRVVFVVAIVLGIGVLLWQASMGGTNQTLMALIGFGLAVLLGLQMLGFLVSMVVPSGVC